MSIPTEFQFINEIVLEHKIFKRDYHQIYQKSGDNIIIESGRPIKFVFGKNLNYIQVAYIGAFLDIDITVRNNDNTVFANADQIRLVNNALAYSFSEATLSTTTGNKFEEIKFVGRSSTIMKLLTSKGENTLT